uniref:Similar to Os07g0681600 n=1 Tax=Arundo donax TaxID=35708 RepID=A0A0A9A0H8_ARUDO
MKRIAYQNGATISGWSTSSCIHCVTFLWVFPSLP